MRVLFSGFLALGLAAALAVAETPPKHVLTTELPPYSFEEQGVIRGISTDILAELLARSGADIGLSDFRLVPWARLYNNLQNDPGTIAYSMARTSEREDLFHWVGPITTMQIGLLGLKSRELKLETIEDLKSLRIGIQQSSAPAQLLLSMGISEDQFDYVTTAESNMRMLVADRVDVFGFSLDSAYYILNQAGMDASLIEPVYILREVTLYYALNKEVDAQWVARLNNELEKMHTEVDGQPSEVQNIIRSYTGTQ